MQRSPKFLPGQVTGTQGRTKSLCQSQGTAPCCQTRAWIMTMPSTVSVLHPREMPVVPPFHLLPGSRLKFHHFSAGEGAGEEWEPQDGEGGSVPHWSCLH